MLQLTARLPGFIADVKTCQQLHEPRAFGAIFGDTFGDSFGDALGAALGDPAAPARHIYDCRHML